METYQHPSGCNPKIKATIKSFCRRHGLERNLTFCTTPAAAPAPVVQAETVPEPVPIKITAPCEQCGALVTQVPARKKKRFCSDACRMAWWLRIGMTQIRHIRTPSPAHAAGTLFPSTGRRDGPIAANPVLLVHGGGQLMTKDQLLCEKHYLACLNVLHRLREKELLTAEEYERVKTLLLEKYKPSISSLFP